MKKVIALFLTVILAFSLLIGCGGKETQTGTLTIMGNIKTENLDAMVGTPHDPNLMSSVFGATIDGARTAWSRVSSRTGACPKTG